VGGSPRPSRPAGGTDGGGGAMGVAVGLGRRGPHVKAEVEASQAREPPQARPGGGLGVIPGRRGRGRPERRRSTPWARGGAVRVRVVQVRAGAAGSAGVIVIVVVVVVIVVVVVVGVVVVVVGVVVAGVPPPDKPPSVGAGAVQLVVGAIAARPSLGGARGGLTPRRSPARAPPRPPRPPEAPLRKFRGPRCEWGEGEARQVPQSGKAGQGRPG